MTLAILVASSDVKNNPVFTDWYIPACKSFIALATGEPVKSKFVRLIYIRFRPPSFTT